MRDTGPKIRDFPGNAGQLATLVLFNFFMSTPLLIVIHFMLIAV